MSLPTASPRPDDPTVRLAAEGDARARRAVVTAIGPAVWSLCHRLSPEPEDAYQEIWAKVFAALPAFDPGGSASLKTWVVTIAHRSLVDRHRRRRTRGQVVPLEALPPVQADADERLVTRQRLARLEVALARLPEAQRRAVILHHLEGRSLDTIARDEGVATGTLKSRLHRARARLAQLMETP